MKECNVVRTPIVIAESEKKTNKNKNCKIDGHAVFPFRQAIGSLLYLANVSCPDITYAVNLQSRKQSHFDLENCQKLK